jgi:alpha/beta superfamily hydrolase
MALPAFSTEAVRFRGGGPQALTYEGALHVPAGGGPWPGVLICHAHPRYGGSMEGPLLPVVADLCAARGLMALRFNFRGVGASTGVSTGDEREFEDVRAAREFLCLHPLLAGPAIALLGYSFGSWAGLRVADDEPERIRAFVAIGFAADRVSGWTPGYARPKCFIHGARDQVIPLAAFEAFYARLPEPKEKHVLPADHFFIGCQADVGSLAADFLVKHCS